MQTFFVVTIDNPVEVCILVRMTAGQKLKAARQRLGLTQQQVAAQLACDKAAVSKYESGRHAPNLERAVLIQDLYGVPVREWGDGAP